MKCGETMRAFTCSFFKREGADDVFAFMLQPALIEAKGDELVQLGGPGDRRDIAAAVALDLIAR